MSGGGVPSSVAGAAAAWARSGHWAGYGAALLRQLSLERGEGRAVFALAHGGPVQMMVWFANCHLEIELLKPLLLCFCLIQV